MQIKLFRSSTVGIHSSNFKLLTDPWLTDGIYYGSWSHYPYYDLKKNLKEINSYDAIYISHIHEDHCDDKTLSLIRKDIPIYIHSFHIKFLKNKLERLGFNVIELENGKRHALAKDFNLRIYAADNCDPDLCFKVWGCADKNAKNGTQQVDTLAVIDNNQEVIVNLNDCPYELAQSTFKSILKNYEKIDLMLTGYCGAGPYPQCFENYNSKEKIIAGEKKIKHYYDTAVSFINSLKPKYYLPYAGTYTLTGKLSILQDFRGNPSVDEAYEYLAKVYENNNDINEAKISYDQTFDIKTGKNINKYRKIDFEEHKKYTRETLSKIKLEYENHEFPKFEELFELSLKAHKKYLDKKLINNVKIETDTYLKVYDKFIKIPNNNERIEIIDDDKEISKSKRYIIYKTDPRLLKMLLMGPKYAHWGGAEGGSHVTYYRKPNIMESASVMSMLHFHL